MNQLVATKPNGRKLLALVLEPGNIHRIKHNDPISVRVEDLFPEGIPKRLDLMIFYSDTPVADARSLAGMADVALDERTPMQEKKRPHCPECKSTIEQLGLWRSNESPFDIPYCASCGCIFGVMPKVEIPTETEKQIEGK